MDAVNIGKRRELFWDDTIIDIDKTGSAFVVHQPVKRECVITHNSTAYHFNTILQDGDTYRMYINCAGPGFAYAESKDGIHWTEPNLGQREYNGSSDNSYIALKFKNEDKYVSPGSFNPFIDTNPNCPPEERIKAISDGRINGNGVMWVFASPDGIHFHDHGPIRIRSSSSFDSNNTMFYNNHIGKYQLFYRDFHPTPDPNESMWIRSISYSECDSIDGQFQPGKLLRYDNPVDWQMYQNNITRYPRADHVLVGLPARYIQRNKWEPNFDDLCGAEARKQRFSHGDPRYGTALTDAMFMTSRDGETWKRYPDAFLRPGPEFETNWTYGCIYCSTGLIETPSEVPGADNELSFFCNENRWFKNEPTKVYRYTLRLDGFVSQWGPWHGGATLTTKPIIFDGKEMYMNFSTSAYGGVQVTIENLENHQRITSCDMMGDSCDRHVHFGSDLSEFAGKPCVVSFKMRDADIYSIIFR